MGYVRCLREIGGGAEFPADSIMNLSPAGKPVEIVLDLERIKREQPNFAWYHPQRHDMWRFGAPLGVEGVAHYASRYVDNLFMSRYFGPGPMALYNMGYNLADIPAIYVGEQIGGVLLPGLAELPPERRPAALERSAGLLALIIFPMAIGLASVSETLVAAALSAEWQGVAPLLTILDVGELDIIKDGQTTPFAVSGGFMEVLPNRVTILADTAERADEIDEARAEAARRSAEERIAQRQSDQELAIAEAELRRALIRLKIAQLKRNRRQ